MSGIHRILLYRLLAAWIVVCLTTGATVSWLGMRKMDNQLVAQATAELRQLPADSLPLLNQAEPQRGALHSLAARFVSQHFIAVEFDDRNRNSVASAVNPLHAGIAQAIRGRPNSFPLDQDPHYSKFSFDDDTVLRIQVPLKEAGGSIAGYFKGMFLVDQKTQARLRDELILTLQVVFLAVTLTTICLYPVIVSLNRNVIRYSNDLLKGNVELMEVLGSAIAKRDSVTNVHHYRVASYAVGLAEAEGLPHNEIRDLIAGAFLHDVGKIGISDTILLKSSPLDERELEIMRTHVALGIEILSKSAWLQNARDVVEHHHEKFDGSGYLKGLAGEAIPVTARILAIVDVFDALTSRRPYKEPVPFGETMAILQTGAGSHFDPRLTAVFAGIAETLYLEISNTPDAAVESRLQALIQKYFFSSR